MTTEITLTHSPAETVTPQVLTLNDLAQHNKVLKKKSCDDSTDAMNGSEDFENNDSLVDYLVQGFEDRVVIVNDRLTKVALNNRKFSSTRAISGDDEQDDVETLTLADILRTRADSPDSGTNFSCKVLCSRSKSSLSDDDISGALQNSSGGNSSHNNRPHLMTSQVDSTRVFADNDSDYQL